MGVAVNIDNGSATTGKNNLEKQIMFNLFELLAKQGLLTDEEKMRTRSLVNNKCN